VTGGVQLTEPSAETISSTNAINGAPITSTTSFESRRYTVGPALEFAISHHISIEFNPLYKHLGSTLTSAFMSTGTVFSVSRLRADAWEFPILGKYYFGSRDRNWRPFTGIGPSWQTGWSHVNTSSVFLDPITGAPHPANIMFSTDVRTLAKAGIVFDGGLLLRKDRVGIAPELRYTRWSTGSSAPNPRDRNQIEILVTVHF
jgi:outer membrane protein W